MPMDLDFIFADKALNEISIILSNTPHGERKKITDDILRFNIKIKEKYQNLKSKNTTK